MIDTTLGPNIYEDIRWVCVGLFTMLIPLLVLIRYRYGEFPAWLMIVIAVASSWMLTYAHKAMEEPMHYAWEREMRLAADEYMRHPPPPVQEADGSYRIENPYGIGDWIGEPYHPVGSLFYGLAYILGCWIAAWSLLHCAPRSKRVVILVSVGVLLTIWAAIIGFVRAPPAIFGSEVFFDRWNPFFGPQLTLPLALVIGWILAAWLPSLLTAAFRPRPS